MSVDNEDKASAFVALKNDKKNREKKNEKLKRSKDNIECNWYHAIGYFAHECPTKKAGKMVTTNNHVIVHSLLRRREARSMYQESPGRRATVN